MEFLGNIVLMIFGAFIFYVIIEKAVKSGTLEALRQIENEKKTKNNDLLCSENDFTKDKKYDDKTET